MADYVAKNLFTNEAEITQLAKRNRNAALRVYDRIREWSAKVNGDTEKEFLLRAQRLYEKALRETRGTAGNGQQFSFVGLSRDGVRMYETDFDELVSPDERKQIFKDRIESIFNLGAVELRTDLKKIIVNGDKFTMKKNLFGDDNASQSEMSAKINALYDLVDILQTSKYDPNSKQPERSYINPEEKPKNKAHKDVKYWYKFRNTIIMDGVPYNIAFSIRDKGKNGQYQYLIEFKESEMHDISHTAVSSLRQTLRAPHNQSISQTNANSNTSGENVTQLQQSKRQNAFTDESDELFAKPVYSKPPLSKEDLEARYEAEKAYNREARESTLFSQAEESDDAEDLSDRDVVLDEFRAETYQDGPEDIEASREEYEQYWQDIREQFQARSDELAAESGNKTGMEDLAAFLASEREITEEANIAREERARGKVAFSEGAAESDANAFTRDMLNGRGKDGFDRAQKKAASDMGFAMGQDHMGRQHGV